jgi:hypothetical protein
MSQNDFVVANGSGATVRADINSALQALASSSSGATAPSLTYQFQPWFDTTTNILKIRNLANTAWVNVASLVGTVWRLYEQGTLLLDRANTWTALANFTGGLQKDGIEIPYRGTLSKVAAYTVALADIGKTVRANTGSGGFAVDLPAAATAGDGFEITVVKTSGDTNLLTVDGNAAELINAPGGARNVVNLPSRFDRLKLVCDGTAWHAVDHRITFESAEQTVTLDAELVLAHSLGVKASSIQVALRNNTAEHNFLVGEEVIMSSDNHDTSDRGLSLFQDATNITIRTPNFGFRVCNTAAPNLFVDITTGNWRWVVRAAL